MKSATFDCKYPIMLAAMNKVSTIELAIAASQAGIFPSLSGFNHYTYGAENKFFAIEKDLKRFYEHTASNNIVVSLDLIDILQDDFVKLASTKLFSHVEILDQDKILSKITLKNENLYLRIKNTLNCLSQFKVIPIFKCLHPQDWNTKIKKVQDLFDVIVLKSADAAGSVKNYDDRCSLLEEFKTLTAHYPNKTFIPTGGISSSFQIKQFIDHGATLVGIGSYFTTATESVLSKETKEKIISSSFADIKKIDNSNQNAIIFSKISSFDINQTHSLIQGISNPSIGHIFMSKSVDNITSIKPIKDLVNDLVVNL